MSHYSLFADGLWCALGEPAKKSFDIISNRGNGLIVSQNNTSNLERNRNLINTRPINQSSVSGTSLGLGSTSAGGIKFKEWFDTINHKWTKIKRQIPNVAQFGVEPLENYDDRQLISSQSSYNLRHHHHCCHCRRRHHSTDRNFSSKYIDRPLPFVNALYNAFNDEAKDHDYVDIDEPLARNGSMIKSSSCDGLVVSFLIQDFAIYFEILSKICHFSKNC